MEAGFNSIFVFGNTYFSGDPPHDLVKKATPSPPFHHALCEKLRRVATTNGRVEEAVCAPRGTAKSTWVTNIFILWIIAYAEDLFNRYWVIVMDKEDNAKKQLAVVKMELESNETFRADFGDLRGPTWSTTEIITKNNVKIEAAGVTEGIRGTRFGSERPSLICDDLESDASVGTPDRIAKMVDLFDKTIVPLGDPQLSKVFLIGTVLHYNSLLSQVMKRGKWGKSRYKSIITMPERMDLWHKWEEIMMSRDEGETPEDASTIAYNKAMQFYEDNKDEMERGAQLLWPERYTLPYLMTLRFENRMSFNSEYQNEPVDEDTRVFRTWHYYKVEDAPLHELDVFFAVDPSMGQSKRSDYSVILIGGRHKRTGIIYVLECDMRRRHPDEIERDLFEKTKRYTFKDGCIETVAFQAYFRDAVMKKSAQLGIYLPCREFKTGNVKKDERIRAIEPDVTNGYVRFLPTQLDLIEQMSYYPKAEKRDAIDSLAMLLDLVKSKSKNIAFGTLG
jgi:predicted phage terminase large subunit-like protein